jgi:RHH-type proline utilization regulon transcriptional repressor/proline dehydrogenase/delta 1-pyrroline-5-carboxylate dehydrogenase
LRILLRRIGLRGKPFGGFKLSGGGTKAGGREYLQNFLVPRVVSENCLRRGFAPADL